MAVDIVELYLTHKQEIDEACDNENNFVLACYARVIKRTAEKRLKDLTKGGGLHDP